jgi:MraZ protein
VGVQQNAPFTGILAGSLDKKGRVCIPAPYRHILGMQDATSIYVRKALLTPSLDAFGAGVVQRFHDAQSENDPYFTPARATAAFALLAMSQLLAVDDTGRMRLPDDFIAHAGLAENVTFVGVGRKFEIWDTARFQPVLQDRLAAAREEEKRQAEQG